jgi:hypothetical protein
MTLYSGMRVRTAMTQGMISLLNLDFRNANPLLLFRDIGIRYPEMKNTAGITITSNIVSTMAATSLLAGSATIQKDVNKKLYTPPAWYRTTNKMMIVLRLSIQ